MTDSEKIAYLLIMVHDLNIQVNELRPRTSLWTRFKRFFQSP